MIGGRLVPLFALLALAQAVGAESRFTSNGLLFDTGRAPRFAASGDLDRDGRPDLAIANSGSNTVSVLLSHGRGEYAPRRDFAAGTSPVGVGIADFDEDGTLDLAVVNSGTNLVQSSSASILLGRGDGTFRDATHYPTGFYSQSLAIADLDRDGHADVAVADHISRSVSILLGRGDGTLSPRRQITIGGSPWSVVLADFNGDRLVDLAVTNGSSVHSVSIRLGNGDGTFGSQRDHLVGDTPFSLAVGDLDRDGVLDVATANFAAGTVSVLLGNGDGSLGGRTDLVLGHNPQAVTIADLDADGNPDLSVVIYETLIDRNVWVLIGRGDGTFRPKQGVGITPAPTSVLAADLDGDTMLDLVLTNQYSHNVVIFPGNGDGTFGSATNIEAGASQREVALADMDRNGRLDLVLKTVGVSVLLAGEPGRFGTRTDYPVGSWWSPRSLTVGDLDQDGALDVVTANGFDPTISVLLGNGDGTLKPSVHHGAGGEPSSVVIADLDLDGVQDLAVTDRNFHSHHVKLLFGMGAGSLQRWNFAPTGFFPEDVASADLNADGYPDLVVANWASHTISVILAAGNGEFAPRMDLATEALPRSLAIGDLNGDQRLDLAVACGDANVSVFFGHGDGTFGARSDHVVGRGPGCVAIGDLDADGVADLATANANANSATVLLGRGDGTFGGRRDYGVGATPTGIAIGDLDADSRADLVVANFSSPWTSILWNRGPFPPVGMALVLSPRTLNPSSQGRWMTAVLEPAPPRTASQIEVASIRLNDLVPVDPGAPSRLLDEDGDRTPGLMVKFDRGAFARTVSPGDRVPVRITGTIDGRPFVGADTIRVLGSSVRASVDVEFEAGAGAGQFTLAIHGVRRSPASASRLRVEFELANPAPARLDVLDVSGRRVAGVWTHAMGRGRHELDLGADRRLRAGIYFVRLVQEGNEARARAAVVH